MATIHRMIKSTALFAVVLGLTSSWAAKAPVSDDKLKKNAQAIVSGKVLEVTSEVKPSKVETGPGTHRDTVFTITIEVETVSKGDKVKAGDKIKVLAWKTHTRQPNEPGLQGHGSIPRKGNVVTCHLKGTGFYLKKSKASTFVPIHPNGIKVDKPEG